ncbi:hypothetical protein ACFL27_22420 [candidate division CSSED10-310 bacterium]|uniref:Tetratricopeptide repeat protein n=1 Tax=candidate division CSSED10-310 bacterium TaxID=2855610 RepID=A0ABV6Z3D8_UNCC1
MVSGHLDGHLRVWELPVGRCMTEWRAYDGVGKIAVAVTPDRRCVISGTADGTVRAWDWEEKRVLAVWEGHTGPVHTVAVTPDGRHVVSGGMDKTLKLWEFSHEASGETIAQHSDWVRSISVSQDGRYIASGGRDRQVRIWETATCSCVATLGPSGHEARAVALVPDSQQVLVGMGDGTIRLWNWGDGACLAEFRAHAEAVCAVILLPDSLHAVSAGRDATVKLWELPKGRCLATWKGHRAAVNALAVTNDGNFAVSGSEDGTLKLWQCNEGRCLRTLQEHRLEKNTLSITPDGRFVVSGGPDRTLKVWELTTGHCIAERKAHGWHITALAVTSDGGHVVSGSGDFFFDDKLTIWRLPDLEPVAAFHGIGAVQACAAGPDRLIAVGNEQGRIYLFQLEGLPAAPLLTGQKRNNLPVNEQKSSEQKSGRMMSLFKRLFAQGAKKASKDLPAEPSGERERQDAEIVDDALQAIERRDIPTARRLLRDVVTRAPTNYRYSFRRGADICVKFWDRDEFQVYVSAVKHGLIDAQGNVVWMKSAYPRAYYYLAFLDVEAHDVDRALTNLEEALKLEPDQPYCLGEKAMILSELGRKQEAIRMYEHAISVRPYLPARLHAKFLRGRAVDLIDLHMLDQAETSLLKSLQYEPNSSVAHNELAYIRNLRGGGGHAPSTIGPSSDTTLIDPLQQSRSYKPDAETEKSDTLFTEEFLTRLPKNPLDAVQVICRQFFDNYPTIADFQSVPDEEVIMAIGVLLMLEEKIYPEPIPVDFMSFGDSPRIRSQVFEAFQWLKQDSSKRLR